MSITVKPDDQLLSINDAANLSGRYVRYWRSDVIAWMAAQEAASSRGGAL